MISQEASTSDPVLHSEVRRKLTSTDPYLDGDDGWDPDSVELNIVLSVN